MTALSDVVIGFHAREGGLKVVREVVSDDTGKQTNTQKPGDIRMGEHPPLSY